MGRFSLTQCAQNSFAKRFHLAWILSESSNSLGAEYGLCCSNKMWLGVKGSKSLGSLGTRVIGLFYQECRQGLLIDKVFTDHSMDNLPNRVNKVLPKTSLVTGCWWIEVPLNVPSKQLTSNPLLVPSLQRMQDISLHSSEV